MDKDKLVDEDRAANFRDCNRLLVDVNYQLDILAGRLDQMGEKSAVKNILAAHAQINSARAALRSHAPK